MVPTPISDRDRALSELLHKTYIEAGMQLTVCSVAILATTKEEAAHVSQVRSLMHLGPICMQMLKQNVILRLFPINVFCIGIKHLNL